MEYLSEKHFKGFVVFLVFREIIEESFNEDIN